MKYKVMEKTNSLVIFIDVYNLKTLCQIADLINDTHPGSIMEVTHNFIAKQGNIWMEC